jgi:hypothetical protein
MHDPALAIIGFLGKKGKSLDRTDVVLLVGVAKNGLVLLSTFHVQ